MAGRLIVRRCVGEWTDVELGDVRWNVVVSHIDAMRAAATVGVMRATGERSHWHASDPKTLRVGETLFVAGEVTVGLVAVEEGEVSLAFDAPRACRIAPVGLALLHARYMAAWVGDFGAGEREAVVGV